jgi:hypothetical protein
MAYNPSIREHPTNVPASNPEQTPHFCYAGWVYLGFEGEDENGEYIEITERVLCRRCNAARETS